MYYLEWKNKASTPETPSHTTPHKEHFTLLPARVRGIRIEKDCQVHSDETLSLTHDLTEKAEKTYTSFPTLPSFLTGQAQRRASEAKNILPELTTLFTSVPFYHILYGNTLDGVLY